MATIQEDILNSFYAKLSESKEVDKTKIDELRALFQSGKKLKADDFVAVLAKKSKEGGL